MISQKADSKLLSGEETDFTPPGKKVNVVEVSTWSEFRRLVSSREPGSNSR